MPWRVTRMAKTHTQVQIICKFAQDACYTKVSENSERLFEVVGKIYEEIPEVKKYPLGKKLAIAESGGGFLTVLNLQFCGGGFSGSASAF